MITIEDKIKCCGCTACANVCPNHCIEMNPDFEGFVYPVADVSKCVNCNLCKKVCPILNGIKITSTMPVGIFMQNKDKDALKNSTSGGFFDVLCKYATDKGGYIVGVMYDEHFMTIHNIAETYEESFAFRGSKYAQSKLGDIFSKVKYLLDNSKLVVFSGTPCQVAGLKSFLRKEYEKLITVDLVCRSIPSPLLWQKYLDWQKKQYHSDIDSVNCRSKTYGYHSGSLVIRFKNGKKYSGSNRIDLYMKSFHRNVCSRPSCYECKFKTISRCSDFTMFDCWYPEKLTGGFEKDNDKGYTNVFIHTQRGTAIFDKVRDRIHYYSIEISEALNFTGEMMEKSIYKPAERDIFYKKLESDQFEKAINRFVSVSWKDTFFEYFKSILAKSGLIYSIKKRIRNGRRTEV